MNDRGNAVMEWGGRGCMTRAKRTGNVHEERQKQVVGKKKKRIMKTKDVSEG